MEQLKARVITGDIRLSDAIARALPKLRGLVADEVLVWCSHELQGYPDALSFYQRESSNLPPYRVVNGVLKVVRADGQIGDIAHPLASRRQHFLSAPMSWIEDFFTLPGEVTVVDLPELTKYIGKQLGQGGHTIVCQCHKSELLRIQDSVKASFLAVLDQVIAKQQARKAANPVQSTAQASRENPFGQLGASPPPPVQSPLVPPSPQADAGRAPSWTPPQGAGQSGGKPSDWFGAGPPVSPLRAAPVEPKPAPVNSDPRVEAKSLELMNKAYVAGDGVIPTWTFSFTAQGAEREFNHAVINYMFSQGWVCRGRTENVILLTQAGARQVEKLLAQR